MGVTSKTLLAIGIKKILTFLGVGLIIMAVCLIRLSKDVALTLAVSSAILLWIEKLVHIPVMIDKETIEHVFHIINMSDGTEIIK